MTLSNWSSPIALTTNYVAYDLGASVMQGSPGWMMLNQH